MSQRKLIAIYTGKIADLKARNSSLRKALHGLAVTQLFKTRKLCSLCGSHWDRGEVEGHRSFCVLATR